jgi:cytochrome P450
MEGPLTYTRMQQMSYLPKVVSETLRLFPGMMKRKTVEIEAIQGVALLQPRVPRTDTMLGPHHIPKGSTLFIAPYLCHRNGKYWKNPDTFNPLRQGLDTSNSGSDLKYFPFGYGVRQCQVIQGNVCG